MKKIIFLPFFINLAILEPILLCQNPDSCFLHYTYMEKSIMNDTVFNHNLFIQWKPEYNLGIHIIDEQHKGIVSTINSLFYAMQNKHGENVLKSVVNMVTEYTHIHFNVEEDFLRKCGFTDFKKHQDWHNELRNKLSHEGSKSLWDHNPQEFLDFLKNWWIDHICEKDRIFRDYLLSGA